MQHNQSSTLNMVKAKKFILKKYFDGFPTLDDLKLVEEELPPLQDTGTQYIHLFLCFVSVHILYFCRIFSSSRLHKR